MTPHLWFFTDPLRTPDPVGVAVTLPAGSVVVYRAFGGADAVETAARLRRVARARKLILLIGADAGLARRVHADGVHLPQRLMHLAARLARPHWTISVAAHDGRAIKRSEHLPIDAVVVSAAFPSRSPSAKTALGPIRFARLIRGAKTPVIALGGINNKNAPRLISTGASGIAAIDGLSDR